MPDGAAGLLNTAEWPSGLPMMAGLGLMSLVPALFLMTTSFVRISIVLGFLRQAIGTSNLPSNQVVTALSLLMTLLVMRPVWTDVYQDAVEPYLRAEGSMTAEDAWRAGVRPVRRFMARQIDLAGNSEDVWLFWEYARPSQSTKPPEDYDEVPLEVLAPAFLLSELKVAFLIGFQVYLPLLVVDLLIAAVSTSLGMVMLPPAMVSLPLKVLLFVLVDGWRLVVGMLLGSFAPYG